jgi:hypothetical protein
VEPFLDHDPASVEEEDGGIRDTTLVVPDRTPELRVMPIQVLVQHAQFLDGSAPFVRKQRKSNPVLRRKSGKRVDGIVANRKQCRVGPGQVRPDSLQLDELRLAVGSPPRTAVEHDKRSPAPARLPKANERSGLVGQSDVGETLPDPGTLPG